MVRVYLLRMRSLYKRGSRRLEESEPAISCRYVLQFPDEMKSNAVKLWEYIFAVVIVILLYERTEGSLNGEEKQTFLDLHNYHRAKIKRNQLVIIL